MVKKPNMKIFNVIINTTAQIMIISCVLIYRECLAKETTASDPYIHSESIL